MREFFGGTVHGQDGVGSWQYTTYTHMLMALAIGKGLLFFQIAACNGVMHDDNVCWF